MNLRMAALAIAIVGATGSSAAANEEAFVFVSKMPVVEGSRIRTVTRQDSDTGMNLTQTTYRHDTGRFVVATFVVTADCFDPATVGDAENPFIIAVKYQPKDPKAFSVAGLHDIFKDVYVRDRQGRVRAFENMGGREMIELTETFKPECIGI
jgi:hypothetical protein